MARSNDEIRGVLVQTGIERVLLPNANVAEVLARATVDPIAGAPDWLAGQISWHGWQVPVISFARLSGQGQDRVADNSRVVVLKALGNSETMPYFGLLTQSFPRLISVPRDGLLADATEEALPTGVQVRVLLGDEAAVLPDLELILGMLDQALAGTATSGAAA
ncbi:MAG TPA: chemotaxis protein CheW [Pseudoxanthomonas sp.]|nr:chemotaxis protein CheW [Pseudoxanthomonas sp.]